MATSDGPLHSSDDKRFISLTGKLAFAVFGDSLRFKECRVIGDLSLPQRIGATRASIAFR
jgi:hypothetical protein